MGKMDWSSLEVVEEWTPLDPNDPIVIEKEGRKLRLLVSLTLKACQRDAAESRAKTEKINERIRRKAGLAA